MGKNICVGNVGASYLNLHRQIQIGCQAATTPFVIAAEADCLYPPDYFHFMPTSSNTCYLYDNIYILRSWREGFLKKNICFGALITGREFYLKRLETALLNKPKWGSSPKDSVKRFWDKDNDWKLFGSDNPVISFKTGNGVSLKTKTYPEPPVDEVPYWGKAVTLKKEFLGVNNISPKNSNLPNKKLEKTLWETLAKTNARYYIFTDFGKKITEERFRQSGQEDYQRFILKDSLLTSRDNILEIGCGIGRMTEFLAADFKKVFCLDISKTMINMAKERLGQLKNVSFIETDGTTIPIKDESIDIVFSYIVFQHIKSKDMIKKYFEQAGRVLKPKGIFKVLLKSNGHDFLDRWWGGVSLSFNEVKKLSKKNNLKIINTEPVPAGRIWLWLTKSTQTNNKKHTT